MARHGIQDRLTNCRRALAAALVIAGAWLPASAQAARPRVNNPHGDFKENCSLCHSASAWKPARVSKEFDHEKYGIPLTGAHASVACTQCHTNLEFSMTSSACVDCHSDVHNGELGTDCARCHGTKSFIDRNDQVRMHRLTRFPLAGAHQTLDCEMCHQLAAPGALSFVNTPTECESCHLEQYMATTSPDHRAAGISDNCVLCHNEQAWFRTRFDHAETDFPLTGAHTALQCDRCHVGNVFGAVSTACVSCHQGDYDGTVDPGHVAAGFSTDCVRCHSTSSWSGARFDHSGTAFPLTGAHVAVACDRCHVGGVYSGLPGACVSCHQGDYDGTSNPAHAAAGFSTACADCHTTMRWEGASFDHTPWFPIYSGKHAGEWNTCQDCHTSAASYAVFNCLGCHPHSDQTETDGHHAGRDGYAYESNACYTCHPDGRQ